LYRVVNGFVDQLKYLPGHVKELSSPLNGLNGGPVERNVKVRIALRTRIRINE